MQFEPMGNTLRDIGRKNVIISICSVKKTEEMTAEIDDALTKFHSDYIDLCRLYTVNDERMNVLEKSKKTGKIRAIGVVSHDEPTMQRYIRQYGATIDFVMIVYNFHHNKASLGNKRHPYNDYSSLLPSCERLDLGIIGIKPMGSDAMIELARKEKYFEDKNVNIAQAMLRYVYTVPEIDCTMPAMNSIEEVLTNLESAYKPAISDYEYSILSKLSGKATEIKEAYLPPHYKWLEKWAVTPIRS
jgi:predicted aldo/keto reductase-like oxidoreductase